MDSVDRNERDEKLAEDNGKQGLPVDRTVSQAPTCIYYWSYRLAPSGMDRCPPCQSRWWLRDNRLENLAN